MRVRMKIKKCQQLKSWKSYENQIRFQFCNMKSIWKRVCDDHENENSNGNHSDNFDCDHNPDTGHYYNDFQSEYTDSIDINQNDDQMKR